MQLGRDGILPPARGATWSHRGQDDPKRSTPERAALLICGQPATSGRAAAYGCDVGDRCSLCGLQCEAGPTTVAGFHASLVSPHIIRKCKQELKATISTFPIRRRAWQYCFGDTRPRTPWQMNANPRGNSSPAPARAFPPAAPCVLAMARRSNAEIFVVPRANS